MAEEEIAKEVVKDVGSAGEFIDRYRKEQPTPQASPQRKGPVFRKRKPQPVEETPKRRGPKFVKRKPQPVEQKVKQPEPEKKVKESKKIKSLEEHIEDFKSRTDLKKTTTLMGGGAMITGVVLLFFFFLVAFRVTFLDRIRSIPDLNLGLLGTIDISGMLLFFVVGIPSLLLLLISYLGPYLGELGARIIVYSSAGSGLFGGLKLALGNPWTKEQWINIFRWIGIAAIVFFTWNAFTSENLEFAEVTRAWAGDIGTGLEETWLAFACPEPVSVSGSTVRNPLGIFTNQEKCDQFYSQTNSQVIQAKKLKVSFEEEFVPGYMRISSDTRTFSGYFSFDSSEDIEITKFVCFTGGSRDTPFYVREFEERELIISVDDNRPYEFECQNVLEGAINSIGERDNLVGVVGIEGQFFIEVYYKVTSVFSQDISVINCNHDDIISILNDESRPLGECKRINDKTGTSDIKKSLNEADELPRGDNVVSVDTQSFYRFLPLHIGDGEIRKVPLAFVVKESDVLQAGKPVKISIEDLILPPVLRFEDENGQSELQEVFEADQLGEIRPLINLYEDEGGIFDFTSPVQIYPMRLEIETELYKRGLYGEFEIEKEVIEQLRGNTQEETQTIDEEKFPPTPEGIN